MSLVVIDSPIDDTVQLDEMADQADASNFRDFQPDDDDVKILDIGLDDSEEDLRVDRPPEPPERPRVTRKAILTVAVLACVNLLNYMDRFTVAGEWDNGHFLQAANFAPRDRADPGWRCYHKLSKYWGQLLPAHRFVRVNVTRDVASPATPRASHHEEVQTRRFAAFAI